MKVCVDSQESFCKSTNPRPVEKESVRSFPPEVTGHFPKVFIRALIWVHEDLRKIHLYFFGLM